LSGASNGSSQSRRGEQPGARSKVLRVRARAAIAGLAIVAVALTAGYLFIFSGSGGPTCDELQDAQARTDLVWDMDRELIPPGSPDDDPRDTPPSDRRKFRWAIGQAIIKQCRAHPGDAA